MISRRSVLLSGAALALSGRAAVGADIGLMGTPELLRSVDALQCIVEGSGPAVYIMITASCSKAQSMWEASRTTAARLQYRWIPFGFEVADDVEKAAKAFADGTPAGVERMLMGKSAQDPTPADEFMSVVRLQDMLFDQRIAKLLWDSTGLTPAVPTSIFSVPGDGNRVVRGALEPQHFERVAAAAA